MKNSVNQSYEGFQDLSFNECCLLDGGGFKEGYDKGVAIGTTAREAYGAAAFLISIVAFILL